jgi:CubicO group peptidase (beta-lactamase class C family)
MKIGLLLVAPMLSFAPSLSAQVTPAIVGDYTATTDSMLVVILHLRLNAGGALTGSADVPSQSEAGDSLEDIRLDGLSFSFAITRHYDGEWKGTVSSDGNSLNGEFIQWAGSMSMNFVRTFAPATKPSPIDGIWLGELATGNAPVHIQVVVKSDTAGREFCTVDSPDQQVMGMECANVVFFGTSCSFDIPAFSAHWSGTLSADGNSLNGTLSKGGTAALNFSRQSSELPSKLVAPSRFDAAMAPLAANDLQAVMDRDLADVIRNGELAPLTGAGVSIGVYEHGVRRVFSYGAAKPDKIFEIGAVTKTFTALMLSQMVAQGKAKLDEPVRELLPRGTVAKPDGPEITLLDLATRRSGLRWFPSNLYSRDLNNPYADYSAAKLYAFVGRHGVAKRSDAPIRNSELAFGLLGQALADRSGESYPALLNDEIAGPLGLKDTTISLSLEQQLRFVPGHDADHRPAHAWDFDSFAGVGAIRSTAGDMLTYLEANLHPESIRPVAGFPAAATLSSALIKSHELEADISSGTRIALAWLFETETGNYWYNGATGGYSACTFFNPKGDYAAVVLLNTAPGENGIFVDRLCHHISQRFAGKPAISLAN